MHTLIYLAIAFIISYQATVSEWDACDGCKLTHDARTLLASHNITHKFEVPSHKNNTLAGPVLSRMCNGAYFQYKEPVRRKYIKKAITNQCKIKPVQKVATTNETSIVALNSNKCDACMVVATHIDQARRDCASSGQDLRTLLSESKFITKLLGFNYPAYVWLSFVSNDLMVAELDATIEIANFYDDLSAFGLNMYQTLPQRLCDKLYRCTSDPEGVNLQDSQTK